MRKFCFFTITCRRITQDDRRLTSQTGVSSRRPRRSPEAIRCRHLLNPLIPVFHTIGVLCEAKNHVEQFTAIHTYFLHHRASLNEVQKSMLSIADTIHTYFYCFRVSCEAVNLLSKAIHKYLSTFFHKVEKGC